ncbi:MAG: hypothetical protein WC717_06515 [Candidatus Micrarchaeia archaeon]|jgi:hypothetical protein
MVNQGFASPSDPNIEPYVLALRNFGFMKPSTVSENLKVQIACDQVIKKLQTTDHNSTEGKQLLEMLGRNLCHKPPGEKVTELDVHLALQRIQTDAKEFKASFPYNNTDFAQGLAARFVNNLNKNAPQTISR